MSRLASVVPLLVALIALPATAQEQSLSHLAWLSGCWAGDGAEPGTVEHWLPLAGETLLGVSRTVKRGRTVAHEFMQIRRNGQGVIEYIASVPGQAPVPFALTALSYTEAVFENPAHDFPQRIVYRLEPPADASSGPARLKARIEGSVNGKARTVPFPMSRIAC